MPGLVAVPPPRKSARGREKDHLILYLMTGGNADIPPEEIEQLLIDGAGFFHQTSGSLTSAMKKIAERINVSLLERNLSSSRRGLYTTGSFVIVVIRENNCTISISGPAHVAWVSDGQQRHIFDPALSGKGLGSSQNTQTYLSQLTFQTNDLIALCGIFPKDWEADLLNARPPSTLDASFRKLTFTKGDLHAVIVQPQAGSGTITILRPQVGSSHPSSNQANPEPIESDRPETFSQEDLEEDVFDNFQETFEPLDYEKTEEVSENTIDNQDSIITEDELDALAELGVHMIQPSAYGIPPQTDTEIPDTDIPFSTSSLSGPRSFPPSIPRAAPPEITSDENLEEVVDFLEEEAQVENDNLFSPKSKSEKPGAHAEATRQMAKVVADGIQTSRRLSDRIGDFLRGFIPKLIPNAETDKFFIIPSYVMVTMALIIPVFVAVVSWVIYNKYGLSETYNELYQRALLESGRAGGEVDPIRQRDAYMNVLSYIDQAEQYRETSETKLLRSEAQSNLDSLMGMIRLEFVPAFTNGLGNQTQISRLAASESDLYMLDAERGNILHATFTGRSLEFDGAFNCQPGTYGGYQVGTIVDILALPRVNAVGASVLGIDIVGNLLYCSPGQVPQVFPLPPLPNINWGRITSFVLDNDRLYILDSESRAVWVYNGRDSSFLDPPYFFFGNQIPAIDNAIDIAVSGDDLYILHSDGHMSACTYSRINEVPTRCTDPASRNDSFPAHQDFDIFAEAHFTQLLLTTPPNTVAILLDADNQNLFRLSPRSLDLQNLISGFAGKASPFKEGPIDAFTVSPNYVLYVAIDNQVYFATNLP